MAISTFSSGIKDSSSIYSIAVISISVRRLSPYLSLISNNSSLIIFNTFSSEARIPLNSSINFNNSFNSSSILSLSKPVNLLKRISNMASA